MVTRVTVSFASFRDMEITDIAATKEILNLIEKFFPIKRITAIIVRGFAIHFRPLNYCD